LQRALFDLATAGCAMPSPLYPGYVEFDGESKVASRLVLKITDGTDLHRITLQGDQLSFPSVRDYAADVFGMGVDDVRLQYIDDEEERITVTSSEEWTEALRLVQKQKKPVLRLNLQRLTPSSSAMDSVELASQRFPYRLSDISAQLPAAPCDAPKKKEPPACPAKIIVFTVNLLVGLALSQLVPLWLSGHSMDVWSQTVKICTMICLAFIMINVGYEFDLDKSQLSTYAVDYGVAMTAATFPWLMVAAWFIYALPVPLHWTEALIAARFAAPTSAGILFSMLEAAGMKQTWLFRKARVLAIFDDLDTILLMVPLKLLIVGLQWELSIDLLLVTGMLVLAWTFLHACRFPITWQATLLYAALVSFVCEFLHFATHSRVMDPMDLVDTMHLEVLLPAFTVGCIARTPHSAASCPVAQSGTPSKADKPRRQRKASRQIISQITPKLEEADHGSAGEQEAVSTIISAVFMLFVGLSMPPLFAPVSVGHRRLAETVVGHADHGSYAEDHGSYAEDHLDAGVLALHVLAVSLFMVVGKMFPALCYRTEANFRTRIALCFGMCPRGEVGAGVIVISLGFGISGPAITIAVLCLAINLVASSGFIMLVKRLAQDSPCPPQPRDGATAAEAPQPPQPLAVASADSLVITVASGGERSAVSDASATSLSSLVSRASHPSPTFSRTVTDSAQSDTGSDSSPVADNTSDRAASDRAATAPFGAP